MTDYTEEHRQMLIEWLEAHDLPKGLGDEQSACTLAAINLTMTGELTDYIPYCMSDVLGKAAIRLQDEMPSAMRNSKRYKALIPNMPGTGRELENERLAVLMDWMWTVVLPQVQPVADKHGFGSEWERMCVEKSAAAARAADAAARAADAYDAYAAAAAAYDAARAADAAALADDARAADAAALAADAYAAAAAYADDADDFWEAVDPIGVLERMTYLEGGEE